MKIVAMRNEDLPALLDLIKVLAFHPIDEAAFLRMNTIEDLTSPEDLRLLAWQDGRLVGFLLGCVRNIRNTAGPVGVIKLFGVHPAYRRRGIATALFDEVERRFAARGLGLYAAEGVGPHWFFAGVELNQTAAISLLLHRGYTTDRVARVDMRVDLTTADLDTSAAEEALAAEGIALRRADAGDVASTLALVEEHFSPGWRIEVADMERHSPWPVFVAATAERVVGFAATEVSGPRRFGPTGTDPAYRRKGIGGALLKRCLRDLRERGAAESEIGWVGPIGFYARAVGAEVHRAYWCFRKEAAAGE